MAKPDGVREVAGAAATSLWGRDRAVSSMVAAHAAARAGRPTLVLVDGEPGVGKTALLQLFEETSSLPRAIRLRCDSFEQAMDFNVVDLLLRGPASPPASTVEAGRSLLIWLGQQQQEGEPFVLLLDDVQWMDLASVEAIKFALRRLSADRVLVIMARRPPTGADHWGNLLADTDRTTHLRLTPLSEPDVVEMARSLRGWHLSPAAAARLVRLTGGVPLLVQALLHEAPADAVLSSRADLPVTASVGALADRALAALDEDARLLTDALAVLDEPTDRLLLGSVPGLRDATAAIGAALQTRLVVLDRATDHLAFTHALFRDATYDRVDVLRRRRLHQWAAEHTSGYRSLTHQVAAASRPDPALQSLLTEAARRARGAAMPALAAAHTLLARRMAHNPQARDSLLFDAIHDRLAADDLQLAKELGHEAEQAPPSAERSLALGALAHRDGRVGEAVTLLEDALGLAGDAGSEELRARAGLELGMLHAALNDGPGVLEAAGHARSTLPAAATDEASARVRQTVALEAVGLWEVGRSTEALERLSTIRPGREGTRWEPDLFATRGMIRHWAGDPVGALADLDHAIGLSADWGSVLMRDRVHVQRSLTRFRLGHWDAASVDASGACALADSGDRPWMVALAHAVAALVPALRGEWDTAEEHIGRAIRGQEQVPSAQAAALIANSTWHLAMTRGDHGRAQQVLSAVRSDGTLDRMTAVHSYRWVYLGLCHSAIHLGDLATAEEVLQEYTALVQLHPRAPASARLGWIGGQLAEARGDVETADRCYEQQLTCVEEDTPHSHAETLLASGRLRRTRGHRREAIERLSRARVIAARLRALPLLGQVETELARCGLPTAVSHPLGLTEREQDVAALVAEGMTNKEIASELYLTTKTVEYHLGNTFAKLGLANRRELRRTVKGLGQPAHSPGRRS